MITIESLSGRIDDLARKLDALAARADTADGLKDVVEDLRRGFEGLRRTVTEIEARGNVHRDQITTLAGELGQMTVRVGLLEGKIDQVLAKIPSGWAVVGAGAAAGVPSGLMLFWELLQIAGVVGR